MSSYFICPNCGAQVPSKALACPECGSDETTGWSDNTRYDGIDFPDDEPARPPPSTSGLGRLVDFIIRVLPMRRPALVDRLLRALPFTSTWVIAQRMATRMPIDPLEEQVYREVLGKVHGDRAAVERLVEYERQRAPSASRQALLQSVLDRWERDNR